MTSLHPGKHLVGDPGSGERLGSGVVLGEVAVDRSRQLDDGAEPATLQAPAGEVENDVSTALRREPEV
jgi:hypothetical protein